MGKATLRAMEMADRVLPVLFRTYGGLFGILIVLRTCGILDSTYDGLIDCLAVTGGFYAPVAICLLLVFHIDPVGAKRYFNGCLREQCEPLAADEMILCESPGLMNGFLDKQRVSLMGFLRVRLTNRRLTISFQSSARGLCIRNIPIDHIVDARPASRQYALGTGSLVEFTVLAKPKSYTIGLTTGDPLKWVDAWKRARATTGEVRENGTEN